MIVLLLNGKSIKITCNPAAATAQEIFETVIKCENFVENFFLGICALIGGDFVFLPPDLKIHKVSCFHSFVGEYEHDFVKSVF